jgi:hypothetical protein
VPGKGIFFHGRNQTQQGEVKLNFRFELSFLHVGIMTDPGPQLSLPRLAFLN